MHGTIKIGGWRPFTARQVIHAGHGFIWAATARMGPLPVLGFDRYSDASGEMSWRLAGLIPVMTQSDADVTRSTAGRLASEFVLTPGVARTTAVRWEHIDWDNAVAHIFVDGEEHLVTIDVDRHGALRSVRAPRWADPGDGSGFGLHEFVANCSGEAAMGGFRLPARVSAGWNLDSENRAAPFIIQDMDAATFFA